MYLFFDTETAGMPRNWNAPVRDLANWPRMVQLAWRLYDEQGGLQAAEDRIIFPDGFTIPASATQIHGITTARARQAGRPINEVLVDFRAALIEASTLVAHNVDFDEKIVGAEYLRLGPENPLQPLLKICTMKTTADICRLPGRYGYKWPSLSELYAHLFREPLANAHNAAVDIEATARCFWRLREMGVL